MEVSERETEGDKKRRFLIKWQKKNTIMTSSRYFVNIYNHLIKTESVNIGYVLMLSLT